MPRSRHAISVLLALIGSGAVAHVAAAREAVVTLESGRTLIGEIISESDEEIVLEIAGISTPIARNRITGIEANLSVEEEFQQRRAKLATDDVKGRYALAYDMFLRSAYELALHELEALHAQAPDNDRVATLLAATRSRLEMQRQQAVHPPASDTGDPADAPQLLTEEQANLIRVWELPEDLSQPGVRLRVPREVMMEVIERFREDPLVPRGRVEQRDFFRRPDAEQVGFLFQLASSNPAVREYYKDIRISGDPPALDMFRRSIYRSYVQRYFRRLFGEGQVPGVQLVSSPDAAGEFYTNFYLLSTGRVDGQPLINRSAPEQSIFLQWGLPREAAMFPAPEVPGWRPFFSGIDDPNFRRFADWISTLYPNAGDYGIDFSTSTDDRPQSGNAGSAERSGEQP